MSNNNDPIKEYEPFGFIKNIFEKNYEENNVNYSNNLHNCSNDLSNEGSEIEELEHEKFADKKRSELNQSKQVQYNNVKIDRNNKNMFTTAVTIFIIVLYIFFTILIRFIG